MKRRSFLLASGVLIWPSIGLARTSAGMARIGVLSSSSPESRSTFWSNFKDGMAKLGWVEGRDMVFVYRYTRGDTSRMPALAAELVAEKPELIFAGTQAAAVAVRRASGTIPIVFAFVTDPVGSGLVAGLALPGGNATGLTSFSTEVSVKHLELLKEILPRFHRVTPVVSDSPGGQRLLAYLDPAARAIGVLLDPVRYPVTGEMDRALDEIERKRPDGVLFYGGVIQVRQVTERMARLRLPTVYSLSEYVVVGGLISYGASLGDNYRRAADYADKILKGARPGDLPVEQPRSFVLLVNMRAARAQGIAIPQSVLLRADRVIE